MTLQEILRQKGYTEKQIRQFYKKKEKLAKMNIKYTINDFENNCY